MTEPTEQREIRDLLTTWVTAIREGDLPQVLAHHAADIVMFDVPPPERGARGLEAYASTWPDFFAWVRSGAVFEIDELDIVAGSDVAYAIALLRCGDPDELDATPDKRLRLTIGLVKRAGAWLVQHEHHSFTLAPDPFGGEQSVREIHQDGSPTPKPRTWTAS